MIDQSDLWPMSDGAFAHLGVENIAYIRQVEIENIRYFVLMSAQGQEILVAESREAAMTAAYDRNLMVLELN